MNPPHPRRATDAVSPTGSVLAAHRTSQMHDRRARRKAEIQALIRAEVGPDLAAQVDVVDLSDSYVEVRYGSRALHIEAMVGAPVSWYTRRTLGLRWRRRRPGVALRALFADAGRPVAG